MSIPYIIAPFFYMTIPLLQYLSVRMKIQVMLGLGNVSPIRGNIHVSRQFSKPEEQNACSSFVN
jgi:hypothetical protein